MKPAERGALAVQCRACSDQMVIKDGNVKLRPCKPHGHKDELIGDSAHGAVSGRFWIHALSYQVLPLEMIGSTCSLEILINLEDLREFAIGCLPILVGYMPIQSFFFAG